MLNKDIFILLVEVNKYFHTNKQNYFTDTINVQILYSENNEPILHKISWEI